MGLPAVPGQAAALFDCSGRVAVVTGGAGRLGPVWVSALLEAGATVAMVLQPGTADSPEVADLRRHHAVITVSADVTDRDSVVRAREEVAAAVGRPQILVANAGVDHRPVPGRALELDDLSPADVSGIVATNLVGTLLSVSLFGAPMVKARRGSIIMIGSQYAQVAPKPSLYDHIAPGPFVKNPAYGASKAAVVNLCRSFAAYWGPAGVRVNVLSPGGVRGGQDRDFQSKFCSEVPLGRMLEPEELKGPLVFLASDASSYVTGSHLIVDGGYSIW